MIKNKIETVDVYIASFPENVQVILKKIRKIILNNKETIEESISYGMPAYKTHGKALIYYAAFKNHIGLYATPAAHEAFKDELASYKQGKGSVQFLLNKDIPYSHSKNSII